MKLPPTRLSFPTTWNGCLVLGDMPYNAENTQAPFSQSHASAVDRMLRVSGIKSLPGACAFAIVFSEYAANARSINFTAEYRDRMIAEARELIAELNPKLIIALGHQTLQVFGQSDLESVRGAPFMYLDKHLTLFSYHPREFFAQYELNKIVENDFAKARRYLVDGWIRPVWSINYQPTFSDVMNTLHSFLEHKPTLSVDIETDDQLRMTCIGFSWNGSSALTIPFKVPGGRYWSAHEDLLILRLLARVLESCPLAGQNAVHFDHRVLAINHKMRANFVFDTMLAMWEVYCEMPKSLGFINSLYLDNEYWKFALKDARSGRVHHSHEWLYNAKDCIVTLQAAQEITKDLIEIGPGAINHYRFNIRLSRVFQYMGVRGLRFDTAKRDKRLAELDEEAKFQQAKLTAESGRLLNVNSPKQITTWLYDDLKLPKKYKAVKDESGDIENRETSDYLTLLKLAREFPNIPALMTAGRLRKLKKRISTLRNIEVRPDGRVGYSFNVVGTVTGRASSSKPIEGFGIQAQNQDRRDRDLYIADDGHLLLKADLEGADSWTVAAQLQSLGDSTMMNDLLGGIKPAQALGIAFLFGKELITAPTSVLASYKAQFKRAMKLEEEQRGPGCTTYDIQKAVSHGSNYGMQPPTMSDNMFKKSDGELYVPAEACKPLQQLYFARYNKLGKLHETMVSLLGSNGYLDAFSGNRRVFFGRRDNSTIREMLSQLPQHHTGYATNLLLERLYHWKSNRRVDNPLKMVLIPTNQVHDETDCMFRHEDREQAREIFSRASQNRITCWGVDFTIPFEVGVGPNWASCKEAL